MESSFQNSLKFVEDALFCVSPFALSYTDPDQKWFIRKHFVSLFQDFPSFKPSVGVFTHNDGTEVNLLHANGELNVSQDVPFVPLTIWVHEFYPQMAPIVHVNLRNCVYPIYQNHPFVDSSGATTSSYLASWQFSKCNLSDLVRNLIKIFSHNHPFYYSGFSSCSHPSMVSKMEAVDLLTNTIFYDMMEMGAKSDKEIEHFWDLQAELRERAGAVETGLLELDHERKSLKGRIKILNDESDKVLNWLKVYDKNYVLRGEIEDSFEALDKKSEVLIDLKAADYAIEDLMYALDKAVEQGAVSFEVYIKQVRILAREQFFHRAKIHKIER